jgi:hypothetical protein
MCVSVNVVNTSRGVLMLSAAPKAGSTTMRDGMIPTAFPDYINHNGKRKGEENMVRSCSDQGADAISRTAGNTGNALATLIVRDPLSRFVSGVREVFEAHCRALPRWGLALRCGAWQRAMEAKTGSKPRSSEPTLIERDWNTTAFVEQFLEYVTHLLMTRLTPSSQLCVAAAAAAVIALLIALFLALFVAVP